LKPIIAGQRGAPRAEERSVKPSAQPTLVRTQHLDTTPATTTPATQHLPHPGETARWLRKRGPAGRFLLVTSCISVCHYGSMRSSGYGHIADSVRAERAVRITATFADPRPFCPVIRAPDCRASRSAGSSPSCSRRAAGWPCSYPRPERAAGSARAISSRFHGGMTGCASPPPGWKTSTAPWRAARCPDLDAAASRGVMQQRFPVSPVRDWIRRSRSCTCRGLVMDLSCTCRIPAPVTRRITRPCPLYGLLGRVRRVAPVDVHAGGQKKPAPGQVPSGRGLPV
jgi:hypothetical protein